MYAVDCVVAVDRLCCASTTQPVNSDHTVNPIQCHSPHYSTAFMGVECVVTVDSLCCVLEGVGDRVWG